MKPILHTLRNITNQLPVRHFGHVNSFELLEPRMLLSSTFLVTTSYDIIDPNDNILSFREALIEAYNQPGKDTIRFDDTLTGTNIELNDVNGDCIVDSDVDIQGLGTDLLRVNNNTCEIHVHSGTQVTINNLELQTSTINEGDLSFNLAAIQTSRYTTLLNKSSGRLEINDSDVNMTMLDDIINQGTMQIDGSRINADSYDLEGIYQSCMVNELSGTLTVTDSMITGGLKPIVENKGVATITGCEITDCGSGFYNSTETAKLAILLSHVHGIKDISCLSVIIRGEYRSGGNVVTGKGMITIADSYIENNDSGISLTNSCTLSISNVSYINNGSINCSGDLAISRSAIHHNTTAVNHSDGELFIENSSITHNELGIKAAGNSSVLHNVTVAVNGLYEQAGGIVHEAGTLSLVNCTITGNTGRVAGGMLTVAGTIMHNTIVAGNQTDAGVIDLDILGPLDPLSSNNLIGIDNGNTTITHGVNGNIIGSTSIPIDPRFAALADNGGGVLTCSLLPESDAVDAGANIQANYAGLSTDARGFVRQVDGNNDGNVIVDIGAFELPNFTICRDDNAPVIDGRRDEHWLDQPYANVNKLVRGNIDDGLDLSAQWQAMWDQQYLYFFVEVTDQLLVKDSAWWWWHDDCVEILIDDFRFGFRVYDPKVRTRIFSFADTTDVVFEMVTDNTGYRLEAALPWLSLGISPQSGQLLKLDVHVNDDDNGRLRDARLAWHANDAKFWFDTNALGEARLVSVVDDEIVVTTLDDEYDGDLSTNDLSLREAISLATIRPGRDNITFSPTLHHHQIELTLGKLRIATDVNIIGPGADLLTIQGNTIDIASAGNVYVTGLTITGSQNHGVRNRGSLHLHGVDIHDNSDWRITHYNYGAGGWLYPSSIYGTGGGIDNHGMLLLDSCLVRNNLSNWGGGLYNSGSLSIVNSTISGNEGRGIWNGPAQSRYATGGIYNTGSLKITHSTIVNNFTTSSGNPVDGIYGNITELNNSILFGMGYYSGNILSGSNNIIDPSRGNTINWLEQLADNGGPTLTHIPLPGAPAVDAGDNSLAVDHNDQPLIFDQNGIGYPRIIAGNVDIGAIEIQPPSEVQGLSAQPGDACVTLTWTINPEPTVLYYKIEKRINTSDPYTTVALAFGGNNIIDAQVDNDTKYYYKITAVDAFGHESASPSYVAATTAAPVPEIQPTAPVNSLDIKQHHTRMMPADSFTKHAAVMRLIKRRLVQNNTAINKLADLLSINKEPFNHIPKIQYAGHHDHMGPSVLREGIDPEL